MSKTIEEAAKSIAKDFIMENKSRINNDAPLTHECVQYAIERIFALPLASRLTAEEKRQIKKLYCAAEASKSDYSRGYSDAIKRIFGADFFKEER